MNSILEKQLPASALATVLVVSALLSLGVLLVIMLWDNEITLFYRYHHLEQQRANVESGFLLHVTDSSLLSSLD